MLILGHINDPCRIPSAIDILGLSEKTIKWFTELKAIKDHRIVWDVNPIFENSFFQCLVYSIIDYINASKAEAIYDKIFDQYFDFENNEYSIEEGKELRKKFDAEILDISEKDLYGPEISTYLRAHNQLWRDDTFSPDLTAIIASKSGISEISAYGANKYLVTLLEDLCKKAKEEIAGNSSIEAEV